MSKRKRTSKVDKWIKEGRGTGSGVEYQPWLKIQAVSSLGRSTRIKGIKTSRQHRSLLPQEETIDIANEFGIKHPTDPKTGDPIVMYFSPVSFLCCGYELN